MSGLRAKSAPPSSSSSGDGGSAAMETEPVGGRRQCASAGCLLSAAAGSDKCCDFCPRSHVSECLERHTEAERADARRHAASCRAARLTGSFVPRHPKEQSSSSRTSEGTDRRDADEEMTAAATVEVKPTDRYRGQPRGEHGNDASIERSGATEPHEAFHALPSEEQLEEDASVRARRRLRQSMKRSSEMEAAEAHDKAFSRWGAKRRPDDDTPPNFAADASRAPMPVTSQWLGASEGKVSEEQLKRMIVEMTCYNRQQWSHETVASVTGGPRGSVQSVLASLSRGPLSGNEARTFMDIDFGGADDPLVPDWQNLEKTGVLPKLREARAAIYAPGSLPKLRTALNHWLHFTATKARVGFLRPRINDDPGAFLTESLLRQSFVTHLVTSGCNVDTAEQYASLFNSWHVDTMGYGIVASKSFDDEQFKRTNQGLRRLHPATKIDRAAHPIEVNARVLRKNLDRVMAVYDEPGPMTPARWKRIEEELSVGASGGFNRELMTDLVFSAVTELATDGLLRPGEILSKTDPITQSDVTFEHDQNGRLHSATVMITPIKRYHKNVGDKTKKPVVIKAHRGGALRTAELLEIINMVCPCLPGTEKTTQCCRFPVTRTAGLKRGEQKSLQNLTMRKVMKWYHKKCEAAGVPHHNLVKPHSFRIGGATALFAAGVTAEEIQTMGRWSSDVYKIYCRLSKERLLELSSRMSNARSSQFLNGELGFLTADGAERLLEVEEVEQSPPGESGASGGEPEPESDDDAFGDDDDDSDDDGTGVTDDEFLAAIAKPTAPSVPTASDDAHDALAALFCDSDDEASPMSV